MSLKNHGNTCTELTGAEEEKTQERQSGVCSVKNHVAAGRTILSWETLWRADKLMEGSLVLRSQIGRSFAGLKPHIPQKRKERDASETNALVPLKIEYFEEQ